MESWRLHALSKPEQQRKIEQAIGRLLDLAIGQPAAVARRALREELGAGLAP